MHAVEVANAKLTVHLHMTGLRDDGYHLIDSEMVSLDLADTLEFSSGDGLEVVGNPLVPTGHDNLVVKALRLTGREAFVRLTKNIPTGGGLGGGSADAAAVLRWAGVTDLAVGARLGADVPFCMIGGRARVSGVGEVLEPLSVKKRAYTLMTPPFGVNTAAVYRAFDELGTGGADWSERNHLQKAALVVEPRLRRWRDLMAEITGAEIVLAGSGATWFAEGTWQAPENELLAGAKWTVAETTDHQRPE